jgi:tRNA (guanine-N7-)-methyltransferase
MTDAQKKYLKQYFAQESSLDQEKISEYAFIGLEIGFGMGDSIIESAQTNPDQFWIGAEVFHAGISAVLQAKEKLDLHNLQPLEGDVEHWFNTELVDVQFDLIRIFFPDPWPKKRHQKRRLVQEKFFNQVIGFLKPGGILHFASDHEDYAQMVQDLIIAHPNLVATTPPYRPMTKYARKAIDAGSGIYDVAGINQVA